jgi:hypothetical protein
MLQTLRSKCFFGVIVCGVLLSLVTGLVENEPEASIVELHYYGYPLVWRVTETLQPTEFIMTNFFIDIVFWIGISFLVWIILKKIVFPRLRIDVKNKDFFLPLALFIPLGFVMDFVHEFGHALWGVVVGGRFTYMQVAFFEIYPRLAITSQFILGCVRVEGLTGFDHGLFLLGGSMTTNLVAWLLGLVLLKTELRYKTQVTLRILGLFGILDLPFYVIFPQIGLRHWIFLGGHAAEPLVGARIMGMPDPAFYVITVLSTIGLVFLYSRSLRERTTESIRRLLWRSPTPPAHS